MLISPQCSSPLSVCSPFSFGYLGCFKSDFNAVKEKFIYSMSRFRLHTVCPTPQCLSSSSIRSPFCYLRCLNCGLMSWRCLDGVWKEFWCKVNGIWTVSGSRFNIWTMFRWWVSGIENCKVKRCLESVWMMAVGRGRLGNGNPHLYIQIKCFSKRNTYDQGNDLIYQHGQGTLLYIK